MPIKKCNCKHEQQDQLHGKQQRVFNPLPKQDRRPQEYRCTVCGTIRT